MKKIAILVLSVLILSTIFSGCVNKNSIDDLLLDVLNNEQTFIDESNEHIYLKDYKLKENKDIKIIPQKYALIDFDNDGINELVVYVSENYGAYIIFHMYAGNIYGFEFMERALIDLKTDGSFIQSEGAGINAYARLAFNENGYDVFEEAYSNDIDNVYEINEKESTSEKVNNYRQEFSKKESVKWKGISD